MDYMKKIYNGQEANWIYIVIKLTVTDYTEVLLH